MICHSVNEILQFVTPFCNLQYLVLHGNKIESQNRQTDPYKTGYALT